MRECLAKFKARREAIERYFQLFNADGGDFAEFFCTREGQIIWVNDHYEVLFCCSRDDVVGRLIFDNVTNPEITRAFVDGVIRGEVNTDIWVGSKRFQKGWLCCCTIFKKVYNDEGLAGFYCVRCVLN